MSLSLGLRDVGLTLSSVTFFLCSVGQATFSGTQVSLLVKGIIILTLCLRKLNEAIYIKMSGI